MKNLFTIFCLFFASAANAQGEANNWVFGTIAGVSWNSGVPVAFSGSAMVQPEGCSSISNAAGNLLFYSNGVNVWNRLHQQMPNGFGLMGDWSSTQSATIVPWPEDSNKYFLFTQDEEAGPNGLRYSVVYMSMQGGLGDVMPGSKNILLYTPSCEKISVTRHANGIDYWVCTHQWNSNAFYTYLVTSAGINSTPVISSIGAIHGGNSFNSIGYMKFSPDGQKLGVAVFNASFVEAFQFNKFTGEIVTQILHDSNYHASNEGPNGIEFSPNSNLLYVLDESTSGALYQYDLQTVNIIGSRFLVASLGSSNTGALQLAVDKKIYTCISRNTFLSAINYPNVIGAGCGFQDTAIILTTGTSCAIGLPNFVQSYFSFQNDFTYQNNCFAEATAFAADHPDADSTLWNFGDTTSGLANISTLLNPSHIFTSADTFSVTLKAWKSGTLDSSVKQVIVHTLPVATISINVGGDTLTAFNGVTYQWYLNGGAINNATENMYVTNEGGSYTVAITDTNGCSVTSNPVIVSGIHNLSSAFSVNVYPNPLEIGFWNVDCATDMLGSQIEIYDADGRLVFESTLTKTQSQIELNAARGIYMLRISSANNSVVKKLIRL